MRTASVLAALLAGTVAVTPPAPPSTSRFHVALHAPAVVHVEAPGRAPSADGQLLAFDVGGPARDARVTVDARGLRHVRLRTDASMCTGGPVLRCDLGRLDERIDVQGLGLTALPGAHVGDSDVVRVRVTARGVRPVTRTIRVVVGRPDLALDHLAPRTGLRPGSTLGVPLAVRNRGDVAAHGLGVLVDAGHDARLVRRHRNCRYAPDLSAAYCLFGGSLAPGRAVSLADATRIVVGRHLVGGRVSVEAWSRDGRAPDGVGPDQFPLVGRGDPQRLVAGAAPGTSFRDGGSLLLRTTNTTDLRAVGARVVGRTGRTVRVVVGVRNAGPGSVDVSGSAGTPYSLVLTPPPGATVVRNPFPGEDDPWTCDPGRRGAARYTCPAYGDTLAAGATERFVFLLRLDRPGDLRGSVRVSTRAAPDPVPTDDTAAVLLTARGQAPDAGGASSAEDAGRTAGGVAGLVVVGALATGGLLLLRRRSRS